MGVDDRAADREPHAQTVGLRREERVEDAIGRRRIEPCAAVLDRHEHPAWFDGFGGYRQRLRALRDAGARFHAARIIRDRAEPAAVPITSAMLPKPKINSGIHSPQPFAMQHLWPAMSH